MTESFGPAPTLDRVTIMPVVMGALIAGGVTPQGDEDEVGEGSLVCERLCVLAGMAVAKETFGRLGVRCRALVSDGAQVAGGEAVARLGGPLAAMRGAAPTALGFLSRLTAIASGTRDAAPGDPLEEYAAAVGRTARLSGWDPVGHDGPSFALVI